MTAVVLAPVLLVGLAALAAADWQQIGATSGGDQVLVSSVTARKNGLRTAWVRVEYKEPVKLPHSWSVRRLGGTISLGRWPKAGLGIWLGRLFVGRSKSSVQCSVGS